MLSAQCNNQAKCYVHEKVKCYILGGGRQIFRPALKIVKKLQNLIMIYAERSDMYTPSARFTALQTLINLFNLVLVIVIIIFIHQIHGRQ